MATGKEWMLYSIHQLLSPVWTNMTSICSVLLLLLPLLPQRRLWGQHMHTPRVALTLAKAGCAMAALGRYSSYGEHQDVDSLLGKAGGSEAGGWTAC